MVFMKKRGLGVDLKQSVITDSCIIAENVIIIEPVNLYGCILRKSVFIGPFVEIGKDVIIGEGTKISSHTYVCNFVQIGDNCFIGHGVMFTNDKFDRPSADWIPRSTKLGNNIRVGSGSVILPVSIGDNVIIGAGSVVTKDIPPNTIVCGNPARELKK